MENLIKCQETIEGNFCQNENYMDAIKANSGRYKRRCRNQFSDYGTTIYANKIVFASARDTGSLGTEDILGPVNLYKIVCGRCR
jgi:hypothetical protein